jgi:hypothetical protein
MHSARLGDALREPGANDVVQGGAQDGNRGTPPLVSMRVVDHVDERFHHLAGIPFAKHRRKREQRAAEEAGT